MSSAVTILLVLAGALLGAFFNGYERVAYCPHCDNTDIFAPQHCANCGEETEQLVMKRYNRLQAWRDHLETRPKPYDPDGTNARDSESDYYDREKWDLALEAFVRGDISRAELLDAREKYGHPDASIEQEIRFTRNWLESQDNGNNARDSDD